MTKIRFSDFRRGAILASTETSTVEGAKYEKRKEPGYDMRKEPGYDMRRLRRHRGRKRPDDDQHRFARQRHEASRIEVQPSLIPENRHGIVSPRAVAVSNSPPIGGYFYLDVAVRCRQMRDGVRSRARFWFYALLSAMMIIMAMIRIPPSRSQPENTVWSHSAEMTAPEIGSETPTRLAFTVPQYAMPRR